jgi:GAF domain-containing protein
MFTTCRSTPKPDPWSSRSGNPTTVLIRDTLTDERWPKWAEKVAALGVRSVLDVPLAVGTSQQSVGVLGLYSPEPDAFGRDDEAIAHILARHASVAVAAARHDGPRVFRTAV